MGNYAHVLPGVFLNRRMADHSIEQMKQLLNILGLLLVFALPVPAIAGAAMPMPEKAMGHDWSGQQLMEEVYKRHQQFPYIYEEQSMVLVDARGKKNTRKLHRYSRMDDDGSVNFMLIFESPEEVRGVSLLARKDTDGNTKKHIYLPAFGNQLIENVGSDEGDRFLGSDFSVENLTGEQLEEYEYIRKNDKRMDGNMFFVVDVYRKDNEMSQKMPLRRHFIRQDNFFITSTEHYDQLGRVYKKQSHHDLKKLEGNMWRASMILMQDLKLDHSSLIKIHKRVFSADYVPAEMFSEEWLFLNHSDSSTAPDTEVETESEDEVEADEPDKVVTEL